jgi:uncharacterized protein (DUF433 family)
MDIIGTRRRQTMPAIQTGYEHIALDDRKVPIIAGTTMKVVELVQEKIAYGWSAEELHFQHPSLTLGQIYSALAYYADHQDEFDREIEKLVEHADAMRRSVGPSPLIQRLKIKGLL